MSTPFVLQFPTALDDAESLGVARNDAAGFLAATIAADATSLALTLLADADEWGASGQLTIDDEIIYFGSRSGVTFSDLLRGQEGTTAASHVAGAAVENNVTAAYHAVLSAAIQAIEAKVGFGVSVPASGQYLRGSGAGASAWGAIQVGDIPDLSGVYSVVGHGHDGVYQPVGSYLTGLTGDVTAAGPGAAAATLATVNGNVGTFAAATITVDAKGRVTAASAGVSGAITDTKANLLGTLRDAGVIAYASDTKQFGVYTAAGLDFQQLPQVAEVAAPDLGSIQNSPRNGYAASYVTDKSLVNCTVGYSGVASAGGLRITSAGKFQLYLNSVWNDIVFNFVLREISANNYALEHAPIGFSNYLEMMTGMSLSALGRNGLPLTAGYRTTIGAYGYPGKIGGRAI